MSDKGMAWMQRGFRTMVHHDSSGRIWGEVSESGSCYHARAEVENLGDYITEELAMKAVERRVSAIRHTVPSAKL